MTRWAGRGVKTTSSGRWYQVVDTMTRYGANSSADPPVNQTINHAARTNVVAKPVICHRQQVTAEGATT